MNGDVGKVERATLAFMGVREVVEIHWNLLVFYEYLHGIATLFYDVAIIFFGIHERKDTSCAAQRHIML